MQLKDVLKLDRYLNRSFFQSALIYQKYHKLIVSHNKHFILKKLKEYQIYFDSMFQSMDANIKLDNEQRIAILTDEDYNLIVAGAGSGKTTTMIAKIRYLIEKGNVPSNEILAICFGRKNKEELDKKLNQILHLSVPTTTFHQLGKKIIQDATGIAYNVASESLLNQTIEAYLMYDVYENSEQLNELLDYLICFFDFDPDIKRYESATEYYQAKMNTTFETIKSNLENYNQTIIEQRIKSKRTIQSEFLRSKFEVKVANFLYLYQLNYEYEKKYKYLTIQGTTYHPDFTVTQGENTIYIEVLSIDQQGKCNLYSQATLQKYCMEINQKRSLMYQNHSRLILVFSKYLDGRDPLEHLKEELEKAGFTLQKREEKDIYTQLMSTHKSGYYYRFMFLVNDFILKCKTKEISIERLEMIADQISEERTRRFIRNIIPIYRKYQILLHDSNTIDFEDMIIMAKNILKNPCLKLPFHYRYIIIDEYQDISTKRFALIKSLIHLFHAEMIAIGDDWQAIFGFAGSNVELFTKFEQEMGYGQILKIQNTYRNAQELIDIAGNFVQKDESHLKKNLRSSKHIQKPIVVFSYDDLEKGKRIYNKALAIAHAIQRICNEKPNSKILLIGRYKYDMDQLLNSGIFKENGTHIVCDQLEADIQFSTVHKSKGLEFDNVVIINAINATYGFPSQVKDDPIFTIFHNNNDSNFAYAEERRLFYVALTRTKNKVYIVVPKSQPSRFILEIKDNIHIEFTDSTIQKYHQYLLNAKCPWCPSYLVYQYSNLLKQYAYICTTDKEVCGFRTFQLNPKFNIYDCPCCKNGFLTYKGIDRRGHLIIGCTNYMVGERENRCNYIRFLSPEKISNRKYIEKMLYSNSNKS